MYICVFKNVLQMQMSKNNLHHNRHTYKICLPFIYHEYILFFVNFVSCFNTK